MAQTTKVNGEEQEHLIYIFVLNRICSVHMDSEEICEGPDKEDCNEARIALGRELVSREREQ